MSENRRLEDLKRRVQQDPASIAFAALADEYRREGMFHDAIETCRAGLLRHPAYLSARVTLGRSLLELGEYDEAQTHLEQVIGAAPDNLAAIRALAEIHRRRGDAPDAYPVDLPHAAPVSTSVPEPPAPKLDAPPASPRVVPITVRSSDPGAGAPLEFESHRAQPEPAPAVQVGLSAPSGSAAPVPPAVLTVDPVCERLEEFLAAIDRARAEAGQGTH